MSAVYGTAHVAAWSALRPYEGNTDAIRTKRVGQSADGELLIRSNIEQQMGHASLGQLVVRLTRDVTLFVQNVDLAILHDAIRM
jgi:hypothetical protein